MRLLLPPSEAKTPGGRGRSLSRTGFGDAPLAEHRARLCAIVETIAAGPRPAAVAAFSLPGSTADDALAANRIVTRSGTRRALDRYAGVVYAGLDAATHTPAQRRIANRAVLVFSGLFGVVGGAEPVPDYRVPAAAVLPEVGTLGSYWRPVLSEVLPARLARGGLVLDLRSSDYAALWRPDAALADRVVTVRMLSTRVDGSLGVISYNSKLAKGRLARSLIVRAAAGESVRTPADVAAVWLADQGGRDVRVVSTAGRTRLDLIA